ncbi:MAG: sulfatase [Planctomycetota bacterium]|nr:sulfatase [Planctomycetota bacterium]
MILRRRVLLAFVAAVTTLAILSPPAAAAPSRLNVLFIAVDDLRVELGCYGGTPAVTPHIDRLARRGMLFERAYCQQALCNPSRASLLTGRRPDTLRLWNLTRHFRDTYPGIVTLPQRFKEVGYHTRNIGKVFHNWRTKIRGDPDSWSGPAVMHFARHGSDRPVVPSGSPPPNLAKARRTESRDVPDDAYFDGRVAELAVKALREIADRSFFLAVGFWKPHLPFNAPKRYWDLYDRAKLSLPAHPEPPEGVPALALHNGRELLGDKGRPLSSGEILELRHGYYAAISYLDAQVGKVLDELDRLRLSGRTIVVFWPDHGFHLGENGLWCKTSNFELDARVPLIIATPRSKHPGARTGALVELLDLYPTLLDLCGLPPSPSSPKAAGGLEGVTLRPLLEDPTRAVKRAAYTQHPRPAYYKEEPRAMGCSVRTRRYRYTEWRDFRTGKVLARELYDHRRDPRESRNVVASPPDPAAFEEAVRLLDEAFPRQGYRR